MCRTSGVLIFRFEGGIDDRTGTAPGCDSCGIVSSVR